MTPLLMRLSTDSGRSDRNTTRAVIRQQQQTAAAAKPQRQRRSTSGVSAGGASSAFRRFGKCQRRTAVFATRTRATARRHLGCGLHRGLRLRLIHSLSSYFPLARGARFEIGRLGLEQVLCEFRAGTALGSDSRIAHKLSPVATMLLCESLDRAVCDSMTATDVHRRKAS